MNHIQKKLLEHIEEFEIDAHKEDLNSGGSSWNEEFFDKFFLADTRFRFAAKHLGFDYPQTPPNGGRQTQMGDIKERYEENVVLWRSIILSAQIEEQVALEYEETSAEFSEAIAFDKEHRIKVHEIISELRNEVHESSWMKEEKKQRVLKAINSVQSEIDKDLSNFHLILGKLVDLGNAFGKAGKTAKPAFDRIEQLSNAVRGQRNQALSIEKEGDPLQIEDMRQDEE